MLSHPGRFAVLAAAVFLLQSGSLSALAHQAAQQPAQQAESDKPLMLITWFGPGAIALPTGPGWKPELLTVYDNITRPVAQFSSADRNLTASFILFENQSGKPTAEGCREDVIGPLLKNGGKAISKRADGESKTASGENFATTTYLYDLSPAAKVHQHHLFAFAGNNKTCAEMHISSVIDTPAEDAAMLAVLTDFYPNLTYAPNVMDYFVFASLLFKKSPGLAAPYLKSTLDATPRDASGLTARRVVTDQLVMALGMSGDLKNSRAVAEMAIADDPDYPINYYNLACADAEQGDAAAAKKHLQQAFERRDHALKSEPMPDPTQDDSILKLKKDKAFWDFVQTLPKP